MYANGDRPVNCIFSVTLEGALSEEDLNRAFDRLQARHPLLRAVILQEGTRSPYFDIRDTPAPSRVEVLPRNTDEDWVRVAVAEWQRPFDYQSAPLMRVLWLKGDAVSDLVLVLPHCICDGGTIVNLMRELLAYAADPLLEAVPYASFDTTADLVAKSEMPGKGAVIRARVFAYAARGILSLLVRNKPVASGRQYYMVRWPMDREQSQQLMAACKAAQTTVQAALGVAFLTAFGKVMGQEAKNKLICPVNIRKSVPGIREDMMFAFAPVVELSGADRNDAAFWSRARRMKADLQQKIHKLNPNHLLVLTEYFHAAAGQMVKHLRTTKGGHDITLSNMGRLDIPAVYNGFNVKRVYAPSAALPWRNPNTLVVTSFDGQLDFSLISEEHFLSRDRAQAVRDAFMFQLQQAVAVTG